ncbi:hypothetical protein BGX31_008619 [Mortierella sp. GBA43]|nr:hypothetical protein BGX31_008619 [Mortierella sp. GBA43]
MNNGACKPLWQHTMTNAEQISALGLSQQEIRRQETIFELIYTESEYLDDLKSIHKIFVEELNVKMAESRRKKRFSPDKSDVKLNERLARLLSHIKDLWNGHQSLLRSLQNKQQHGSPVVRDIGSVFESFYMFSIYDSYFAQYTTTSRDFQYIANGNSELCLIMKDLLKSPSCKCLSLEGIFLKPIQRLQKYPLFFKDLMNMTPTSDPDYAQLEQALNNHQRELTKIDDRIWIEEHNEMLTDLQQRIKGLPSNQPTVSQLVSQYNLNLSSSFSNLANAGHPRNISSSALYLPGLIKNSTDVEAEYHVFIFTDIVLWTKRVMSRYYRKEGVPWNFKLVEPVSRLTSVCNTLEDNIFMCTTVNTNSASYLVRTEDAAAAKMWRTTIPTLIPFHCSRTITDQKKK